MHYIYLNKCNILLLSLLTEMPIIFLVFLFCSLKVQVFSLWKEIASVMRHRVFEDGEDDEIDKYDFQVYSLNYHKSEIKGLEVLETSLSSIISLTPMKFWSE